MVGDDNKSFLQTKGLKKVLYGGKKRVGGIELVYGLSH